MDPFAKKANSLRIGITDHAAERYVARVDGSMSPRAAKRHLASALDGVPLRLELPWAATYDQGGWLAEVDRDVAVVVRRSHRGGLAGTTVITRGCAQ